MRRRLLDYLACPSCGGGFTLHPLREEGAHVTEGRIACAGCGAGYPVTAGVPRIIDRAESVAVERTRDSFGYEWKKFPAHYRIFREQFMDWISPVKEDFFKDKAVLDAGCGMGRHLTLSAAFGARDAIGMDASGAADVAYSHTKDIENAHVIQADIYRPPLKPVFDYIYSIGVLHHLPRPYEAFAGLVKLLRPGGAISAWVYGRENSGFAVKVLGPARERIISRLPLAAVSLLSFFGTLALYPVIGACKAARRIPGAEKRLPSLAYFLYLSQFSFRFNWANVFDHISAPIAFYYRRDEFAKWFTDACLSDILVTHRNNNSWRGFGRKPAQGGGA